MNTLDNVTLAAASICGLMLLYLWHTTPDHFDLRHLLIDSKTDRVSLMKCGQLFALLVSTWVLIRETNHDRLTEWLFLTYMGCWAGANLAKRWIDKEKKES